MVRRLVSMVAFARLPFHSVGVLPFALGTAIAWRQAGIFRWDVFALAVTAVVLIMLATYAAGERWDVDEDARSQIRSVRSRFAGGSGTVVRGDISQKTAFAVSVMSLILAAAIGTILQFVYRTGLWTLPLGAVGIIGGFFYSTPPIRWVSRGFGELWIALCYGWLPVAVAAYLQTGALAPWVHIVAIPIGLTIFNVILLNEFPDYESDRASGKRNLLVRAGPKSGVAVHTSVNAAAIVSLSISVVLGWRPMVLLGIAPVVAVAVGVTWGLLVGKWRDPRWLEWLCAGNLIVNLGTTAAFLVLFLVEVPR